MAWYDPTTWNWSSVDPSTKAGRQNLAGGALIAGPMGAPFAGMFLGRGMDPGTAFGLGLPAQPTLSDELVLMRSFERKQRLRAMQGRSAAFLTGPRGVGAGLPSSEIAMAFLRAGLDEASPWPTTTGSVIVPGAKPAPAPDRNASPVSIPDVQEQSGG